jgi:2-methylcitrate dehydratase PrpD
VRLSIGPDIDARFPAETLARLKINLADGSTVQSSVVGPRGDPQRPMCWDDLCEKFYKVAFRQMPWGTSEKVVASVEALKAGDTMPLFECLSARIII